MAPFGVKVLCIEPGFFKTNVTDAAILSKNVQTVWDRLPQEVKDDYGTEYVKKGEFASSYFHHMCFNSHIYSFCSFSSPSASGYNRQSHQDE